MRIIKQVIKTGDSLAVVISKEAKSLGIVVGDYIEMNILGKVPISSEKTESIELRCSVCGYEGVYDITEEKECRSCGDMIKEKTGETRDGRER